MFLLETDIFAANLDSVLELVNRLTKNDCTLSTSLSDFFLNFSYIKTDLKKKTDLINLL